MVGALAYLEEIPIYVLWLYLSASAVAFWAYALDKSAAQNGRWRTRESTLHMFSAVGGWPGALIAQSVSRHKTRKREFQLVFWGTVVVNLAALTYLLFVLGQN